MQVEKALFWQDRPVLVTGATGFVGGWLCRRLCDLGAYVVILRRDICHDQDCFEDAVVQGDVRDQALVARILNEYGIETVFHLAAQAIISKANECPANTFDVNINGTLAVLEALRVARPQAQVVMASSDKAYGDHDHLPYTEDTPLDGLNPYDCSKACADRIAQSYLYYFPHLRIAITRCGNIYGGGDLNWERLIPGTIRRILRRQTPLIHGLGSETRDYFYVEDVVSAYLLLAERDARGPYNFSVGQEQTVENVIRQICEQMDVPYSPRRIGDPRGQINYQCLDASRARAELGWCPEYSFQQGLSETIDWYRARLA